MDLGNTLWLSIWTLRVQTYFPEEYVHHRKRLPVTRTYIGVHGGSIVGPLLKSVKMRAPYTSTMVKVIMMAPL